MVSYYSCTLIYRVERHVRRDDRDRLNAGNQTQHWFEREISSDAKAMP